MELPSVHTYDFTKENLITELQRRNRPAWRQLSIAELRALLSAGGIHQAIRRSDEHDLLPAA